MIFITTGTQLPFDRLFIMIDRLVDEKIIDTEIICQGISNKFYKNFKLQPYFDKKNYLSIIKSSDLIIGHAGIGTLLTAIQYNKSFILIPRNNKLKEHRNSHQLDIANFLRSKEVNLFTTYEELKYFLLSNYSRKMKIELNHSQLISNLQKIISLEINNIKKRESKN